MTRIVANQVVRAAPQTAFDIVVNIEAFPTFMANILSVRVTEQDRDRKVAEWIMEIDGAEIEWTEEILYNPDELTVRFSAIEGMFETFDGFWRVHAGPAGTLVELILEYELGLPEIEDIIGGILRDKLSENLNAMLRALEQRAN